MPVAGMGFWGKLHRELSERAFVCPVWQPATCNLGQPQWLTRPRRQLLRERLLVVIAQESPLSQERPLPSRFPVLWPLSNLLLLFMI